MCSPMAPLGCRHSPTRDQLDEFWLFARAKRTHQLPVAVTRLVPCRGWSDQTAPMLQTTSSAFLDQAPPLHLASLIPPDRPFRLVGVAPPPSRLDQTTAQEFPPDGLGQSRLPGTSSAFDSL